MYSSKPKSTPIPRTPNELATIVARIDSRTMMMSEEYLPRVEKAANAARDGVVELNGTVTLHEERIAGLSRFRNWLIGTIVIVVFAATGFAVASNVSDATATSGITSNRRDIDRHEKILHELPRKADLKRMTREVNQSVNAIPAAMKSIKSPPVTPAEIEQAAEELPLKHHELNALRSILSRARDRQEVEGGTE